MSKRKEQKQPAPRQQGKMPGAGDFALHEHIGSKLKAMFDKVAEEPVPVKFRELLEELERKQPKS